MNELNPKNTPAGASVPCTDLLAEAVAIMLDLVDREPCQYDHHGYCQAHHLQERPCPHERAVAFMARLPAANSTNNAKSH